MFLFLSRKKQHKCKEPQCKAHSPVSPEISSPVTSQPMYPRQTPPKGVTLSQPGQVLGEEAFPGLHKALECPHAARVLEYLEAHPDSITERGFNGQSPLHKAILRGDLNIVDALLACGASPNACNDFDETVVHFACKRGQPSMVHRLINGGGDIHVVDKAGRGLLHHAAHGGGVAMMHYMHNRYGLDTRAVDHHFRSPLHIVASHGHQEALLYLLKAERSNVFQQDLGGNTALHLAAEQGHQLTCWQLLLVGGLRLLHVTNRDGCTALDLARKGVAYRFRELSHLLGFYAGLRDRGQQLQGPVFLWWWYLLCPITLYITALLFSYFVPWPGCVMAVGLVTIFVIACQQKHRMIHICRWPNPMYAGMFAAGLLSSMLCFYVHILPTYYQHNLLAVLGAFLLNVIMLVMYYHLLTKDPGTQYEPRRKESNGQYFTIFDIAAGSLPTESFCQACEIIPPLRTKHCKLCERCFLEMDHHCLFLYRCIAAENHRRFLIFIMVVELAIFSYWLVGLQYIFAEYPNASLTKEFAKEIFDQEAWLWSTLLANCLSFLWGIALLRFQLKVISHGHTTYFQPKQEKGNLTLNQRLWNVIYFLAGRRACYSSRSIPI